MSLPYARSSRVAAEIWQRFLDAVERQVKQTARPWYARRVEAYMRSVPDGPAEQHGAGDLARYLDSLGASGSIQDWYYARAVRALRLFTLRRGTMRWRCRAFDGGLPVGSGQAGPRSEGKQGPDGPARAARAASVSRSSWRRHRRSARRRRRATSARRWPRCGRCR